MSTLLLRQDMQNKLAAQLRKIQVNVENSMDWCLRHCHFFRQLPDAFPAVFIKRSRNLLDLFVSLIRSSTPSFVTNVVGASSEMFPPKSDLSEWEAFSTKHTVERVPCVLHRQSTLLAELDICTLFLSDSQRNQKSRKNGVIHILLRPTLRTHKVTCVSNLHCDLCVIHKLPTQLRCMWHCLRHAQHDGRTCHTCFRMYSSIKKICEKSLYFGPRYSPLRVSCGGYLVGLIETIVSKKIRQLSERFSISMVVLWINFFLIAYFRKRKLCSYFCTKNPVSWSVIQHNSEIHR